jgi:predicted transcriptional regulator
MRTGVDRDRRRKITTPAVPEMPGRIIGQTIVAAFALSVVFGISRADTRVYRIISKMLRDTINPRSDRYKICQMIIENPNITTTELSEAGQIRVQTIDDEIDDMQELGIIQIKKVVVGSSQNSKYRYKFVLNEDIELGLKELNNA